jgi:hypothetical protein
LYTGDEFPLQFGYAQLISNIMSILSFSGGFPILYLIGFINFFIMFWVYKYLQVHHYQKSLIFNKDMADSLIFHLKLALMQHVVFTCFIYSTDIL